jgi:hypothetical protein
MIKYVSSKDLTAKDKAEFQKFIDFSVTTKILSGPIDVTKYIKVF